MTSFPTSCATGGCRTANSCRICNSDVCNRAAQRRRNRPCPGSGRVRYRTVSRDVGAGAGASARLPVAGRIRPLRPRQETPAASFAHERAAGAGGRCRGGAARARDQGGGLARNAACGDADPRRHHRQGAEAARPGFGQRSARPGHGAADRRPSVHQCGALFCKRRRGARGHGLGAGGAGCRRQDLLRRNRRADDESQLDDTAPARPLFPHD